MSERTRWIDINDGFHAGDQPPDGYAAWQEWAEVQSKAGLKQARCCLCVKWKFPQEMSDLTLTTFPVDRSGTPRLLVSPICNQCIARRTPGDQR